MIWMSWVLSLVEPNLGCVLQSKSHLTKIWYLGRISFERGLDHHAYYCIARVSTWTDEGWWARNNFVCGLGSIILYTRIYRYCICYISENMHQLTSGNDIIKWTLVILTLTSHCSYKIDFSLCVNNGFFMFTISKNIITHLWWYVFTQTQMNVVAKF